MRTRQSIFLPGVLPAMALLIAMIVLALLLVGCVANPFKAAQTLDQKAFASYGTFVVFEEQAAAVVQDASIPAKVKQALKAADAKAKPAADSLLAAVKEYESITAALAKCPDAPDPAACKTTTAQKLTIATANLSKWVADATVLINALVSAVKGAT